MKPKAETVAIPFTIVGNRRCITGLQMMQEPWLEDFVKRFPKSFEYAPDYDAAFFIEPVEQPRK